MKPTLRSTQVLKEEAEDIGLQGKDIAEYVTRQQTLDREERGAWRDTQKKQAEDKKMHSQAEVELAKFLAEAEEKRKADEIHTAELQAEEKKRADEIHIAELQAEDKKRADESHIKIQIAQTEAMREQAKIEAAKEQAKIEADKELALKQLELKAQQDQASTSRAATPPPCNKDAKSPKLPSFIEKDEKDKLDSYLLCFERYAENARWEKDTWAIKLSALLTGRAMDVYTRMSDTDANDHDKLKKALLTRYNYTEDGYRKRFREIKPETEETSDQFVVCLKNYVAKWLELSGSSSGETQTGRLITREKLKLGPVGATTMMMTTKVVICLGGCSARSPTEERLRRSQPRSRRMITVLLKILKSQKAPQSESVLLDQC